MVKYLLSLTQANKINSNQKFNQRIWEFCCDIFTLKCNMPIFWYFFLQSQLHFRSIVRDGMALNLYIGAWKDAFKERTKKARRNIYVAHNITICHIVREIFQNEIASTFISPYFYKPIFDLFWHLFFIAVHLVKVSKYQKQFMMSNILPKNEWISLSWP